MKKTIIIMLLLFGVISLKAQNYNPLVVEGKQWNVALTYVPWPPVSRVTDVYKVEGDTFVEGTNYKMLFTTQSENYTDWELCGLLRETNEGQVFHRNFSWNHTFGNETLLYDFSMQPGDSICYDEELAACLKLLSVNDTLLEGENKTRKKYVFRYEENGCPSSHGYETWIEGIGSEYGLLGPGSRFLMGDVTDLLCYYEDEDIVWQNPDFNSCYINTVGLDEIETDSSVSVYPNPVKNKVFIEGFNAAEVKIYNALGQLMKTVKDVNEISVVDLSEGVYVMRIKNSDGDSYTQCISVLR
ncbi:MAG: T9SS type A sorting domain-containing protein [Bacteroidales bacterium]|nr:T9SS type A sorting domain-containing protein [Bacteroidales bacterium]